MTTIGTWGVTILAEKEFWQSWLDRYLADPTEAFQWQQMAYSVMHIVAMLGLSPKRVLEVGGGMVGLIHYFPFDELYATDVLWHFFESCRQKLGPAWEPLRHDVMLLSEKAEEMPLDKKFDLVVMANSLDHCDDPLKVIDNIAATTERNAVMFESTTTWQESDIGTKFTLGSMGAGHPNLFTGDELKEAIELRGFKRLNCLSALWSDCFPPPARTVEGWPTVSSAWRRW